MHTLQSHDSSVKITFYFFAYPSLQDYLLSSSVSLKSGYILELYVKGLNITGSCTQNELYQTLLEWYSAENHALETQDSQLWQLMLSSDHLY